MKKKIKDKELDECLRKLKAIEEERKSFEEWVNAPPISTDDERYLRLKRGDKK